MINFVLISVQKSLNTEIKSDLTNLQGHTSYFLLTMAKRVHTSEQALPSVL